MFVDASAIIAILTREPEAEALSDVLEEARSPITSEQLRARINELEAELKDKPAPPAAELFAEVLRMPAINLKTVKVPAVNNLLLDRFHPEKRGGRSTRRRRNQRDP